MENKKKKLIIGLILIIILGAIVFYLTGHLTKTTICKGTLDMITDEEVEVISSDDKVKETKTKVIYDYTDYVSESYPISYYKDYIKNSNTFYKNVKGVKTSLKVEGNKIIYEVDIQYSQEDMMFGPVLRKNKNELFIRYWQKQYQTYLKIMNDLPSNHPRYLELENQKHLIEGELNESL